MTSKAKEFFSGRDYGINPQLGEIRSFKPTGIDWDSILGGLVFIGSIALVASIPYFL